MCALWAFGGCASKFANHICVKLFVLSLVLSCGGSEFWMVVCGKKSFVSFQF